MKFTKKFTRLSRKDVLIAGGKGASLGEMMRIKIPVPGGFVVLSPAFDKFLEATNLNMKIKTLLCKVNFKKIDSVDLSSNKIYDLIFNTEFSKDIALEIKKEFFKLKTKYVAIRSSATAEDSSISSWAGELESYLNTTQDSLLNNVKKCWASFFSSRAIIYRFEKNLDKTKLSVAVVVQKMIKSEISGVCFTAHPVTKDCDRIVIEAGYGPGESIVGGLITPDTYVVHKKNKIILDKNISQQEKIFIKDENGNNIEKKILASKQKKQKLADNQILKLVEICHKIEKHYKVPQDIEWVFAKGRFYIVQSRPITTL